MTPTISLGKYQILGELGKGGFATVYRARDPDLGRDVALKVLDPLLTRDPAWVARFRREARAVASLDHPRVVTVHEIGQAEGSLYIAMRLVEGGSLAQRIAREGALPWDEVVRLTSQIAEALDFAHGQGVLHRDLKPANVLLDPRLGAVLSDFGFASLMADNSLSISLSGGIVGTPAYIAPEVWEGNDPTPQTDVYALGCIVYEMVTGQALFAGSSTPAVMRAHFRPRRLPETWPEGTPPGLSDVLLAALAQEPSGRYAAAGELSAVLAGLHTDPLAEPYAQLEAAMAGGRWQEALALAGQIRAVDASYRDVASLQEAAQAGLRDAQLAGPYTDLRAAVENGRWQEALTLAGQIKAVDDGYRDVAALEAAALAGLEQAARAQQAAAWREEAERALAEGDFKSAAMAAKKWQGLLPDDPVALEFQARLERAKRTAAAATWRAEAERALAEDRLPDAKEAAQKWQEETPDDPAHREFMEKIERAREEWSESQVTPVGHLEVRAPTDSQTAAPSSPGPASTAPVSRSSRDGSKALWLVPVALTVVTLLGIISSVRREREVASLRATQAYAVAASETERAIAALAHVVDVTISATKDWQNTGLIVEPGQVVSVRYVSGGWYAWCCSLAPPDAEAFPSDAIVKEAGYSALIGRVDAGQPFFVNLRDPIPVSSSGILFLRINDPDTRDNEGEVKLFIEVR